MPATPRKPSQEVRHNGEKKRKGEKVKGRKSVWEGGSPLPTSGVYSTVGEDGGGDSIERDGNNKTLFGGGIFFGSALSLFFFKTAVAIEEKAAGIAWGRILGCMVSNAVWQGDNAAGPGRPQLIKGIRPHIFQWSERLLGVLLRERNSLQFPIWKNCRILHHCASRG